MGCEPCASNRAPLDAGRRRFLTRLILGLGAAGGALAGIPMIGYLFSPLLRKPAPEWRAVGAADQFQTAATVEVSYADALPLPWAGAPATTAAWLRKESANSFIAFSVNCTHLGCPVQWLPDAELFLCPCHGGVYYEDGQVAAGPPPKPLARYPVRVRDGVVEILTSPVPTPATPGLGGEPS